MLRDCTVTGCGTPECAEQLAGRGNTDPLLEGYAREWIERYQGTGRRGFREETRDDTRRLLERYTLTYFPEEMRLSEIGPRYVADYIGWLVKRPTNRGGTLSDSSIRNALAALGVSGDR
jgi:hypothetical protein